MNRYNFHRSSSPWNKGGCTSAVHKSCDIIAWNSCFTGNRPGGHRAVFADRHSHERTDDSYHARQVGQPIIWQRRPGKWIRFQHVKLSPCITPSRPLTHLISLLILSRTQCINSIDRGLLNEGLLDEASQIPNIKIFFKHKVQTVDFDQKIMTIHDLDGSKDVQLKFDFCIGADGSYSIIRRQLMRIVRFVPLILHIGGFICLNCAGWIFIKNTFHTSI